MTTTPIVPVLSDIDTRWLNGHASGGNPFGIRAQELEMGDRFNNLAEFLSNVANTPTVKNSTGGDLTTGTLVYLATHDGTYPVIAKADADNPATLATHVLIEDIADGGTGQAAQVAIVDMDTSGLVGGVLGNAVDLSATAGGIIRHASALTGADQAQQTVGILTKSASANGQVLFFPGLRWVDKMGTSFLQALAVTAAKIALARGYVFRGSASGAAEAVTGTADQILIHDGTDPAFGNPSDAGSLFVQTTISAMLQELRTTFVQKAVIDATVTNPAGDLPLVQMFQTVRGFGAAADDVNTISGLSNAGIAVLVTGTEAITYKDSATLALPNNTDLVTAPGDIVMAVLSGTVPRIMPIMVQAGLPVAMLDAVPDAGNYYTQTTLTLMLQELFSSAIGGTNSATRAYSSGTSQEPANNATLTDAVASEMLTRRDEFAQLLLDQSTPSATAGRGKVVSGGVVAPQGAPDLTVQVSALDAYSQTGRRVKPSASPTLGGFTIPAVGGNERRDIVVCDASGTIVRRVGPEGAPTQADATLTAGDVPLARILLTNGVDTTIQVGNITDYRQTADSIDLSKALPLTDPGSYYTNDELMARFQELISSALGGTSTTVRAYSGATPSEPVDNQTLTAAIGALYQAVMAKFGGLTDTTSPPTAFRGRGTVLSGCGVTPQAGPDNTVIVAGGAVMNSSGRYGVCTATPVLAATTPNNLGGARYDIVVVPSGGGAPVIREGTVITTDPVLTAGDVPLARLNCAAGAFTLTAADIADITGSFIQSIDVQGCTAAPVPAAGVCNLTQHAVNTMTPAAGLNVDNFTGLDDGEWAVVVIANIANPVTLRDNAVGGGNVWTQRAASIVLASLSDACLVVRNGTRYHVSAIDIQAGQATGSSGTENLGQLDPHGIFGTWAVNHATNGGIVGGVATNTTQAAAYAVVADDNGGAPQYGLLSASAGVGGGGVYTNNFQCFPDAEAINDAVYFGAADPFTQLFFNVSATVGVYANDSCLWEYYNGAAWVALPINGAGGQGYDRTDSTAFNGLRPFQQDGCLPFVTPTDWATTTVNGQLGYWIRSRVTAAQITTAAVLSDEHDVQVSEEPWRVPHAGNLTAIAFNNASANLPGNPVVLHLWDTVSKTGRTFTLAPNRRRQRVTCASWALTASSRITPVCVQQAGANEPSNVLAECEVTIATSNHTHLA